MFNHCPGNGKSVKGTGSSSDFIQNQKTFRCGISKDISHLCHFHHKGTLTAGQVIRSSHSGKNPIHNANICLFRRNKGTNLRHENNQGRLSHIGGFSRHIWSRNNGNPVFSIVQIRVIGNKHVIGNHVLHHRMASVFNVNDTSGIDFRTHIMVSGRHQSHGHISIQLGNGLSCPLNPFHLVCYQSTDFYKLIIFQSIKLILCSQNHIFQFF